MNHEEPERTMLNRDFIEAAKVADIVQLTDLLLRGADIETIDQFGLRGLHWGVARNHFSVVSFLVEKGAAVVPDEDGRWPSILGLQCEADDDVMDLIEDEEAKQPDSCTAPRPE